MTADSVRGTGSGAAVKCSACKWAVLEDYGYSNWTQEGTQIYCLRDLHPSGPEGFDQWYGKDERDKFAEQCDAFTAAAEGEQVNMDVDREEGPPWTTDPEVQALLDAWEKRVTDWGGAGVPDPTRTDAGAASVCDALYRAGLTPIGWARSGEIGRDFFRQAFSRAVGAERQRCDALRKENEQLREALEEARYLVRGLVNILDVLDVAQQDVRVKTAREFVSGSSQYTGDATP